MRQEQAHSFRLLFLLQRLCFSACTLIFREEQGSQQLQEVAFPCGFWGDALAIEGLHGTLGGGGGGGEASGHL